MADPKKQRSGVQSKDVDRASKDSFPASDPPSYMGGKHAVGAPKERKTSQENEAGGKKPHKK